MNRKLVVFYSYMPDDEFPKLNQFATIVRNNLFESKYSQE